MTATQPTQPQEPRNTAPLLAIDATYRHPVNGALYVHESLKPVIQPWEDEGHISPFRSSEQFGDVESFVLFVERFKSDPAPLLTWSERGLRAVLDFGTIEAPGRRIAIAEHPFQLTSQWKAWATLANGMARTQRQLLEALEDLSEDIVEPDAATLVSILRTLRATVNATASTDLNADGSTHVEFTKNTTIHAGKVSLPPEIKIGVPVLKGHTEEKDGKRVPVVYRLPVRVRVSVDDQAHLAFRLTMPTAERVLESVYADRVATAKTLLGAGGTLLRAAS